MPILLGRMLNVRISTDKLIMLISSIFIFKDMILLEFDREGRFTYLFSNARIYYYDFNKA